MLRAIRTHQFTIWAAWVALIAAFNVLTSLANAQQVIVEEKFGDGGLPDARTWSVFAGGPRVNLGDSGLGDHIVDYLASGPAQPGFHFHHPVAFPAPNPAFQGDLTVYDDIAVRVRRVGFGSDLVLRLYVFDFAGNSAISSSVCLHDEFDGYWKHCSISLDPFNNFIASGATPFVILSNVRQIGFRHDPAATGPGVPVPVQPGTQAYFDDVQLRRDVDECDFSIYAETPPPVLTGDTVAVEIRANFGICGMSIGGFDINFDPTRFELVGYVRSLAIIFPGCANPDCVFLDPTGRVSVGLQPPAGQVHPDSGEWTLGRVFLRAISPGASAVELSNSDFLGLPWRDADIKDRDAPEFTGTEVTVIASDADNDGVLDSVDNCLELSNPAQVDADFDNIGNRCDQDLNNDCVVSAIDLGLFRTRFFTGDPVADFNSDGVVNAVDLGFMRLAFFEVPGPSGLANACSP